MNREIPLVSICCAAYNHEEYIEDALKGFLMQECDFEYEILIHDDASTDKTADIIRKYEKLYPNKIFPIYQKENQYSQGKKYSDLNYERVRGKYVAICEGDDFWTHKHKLAKQISMMQENPEFGLSFHSAIQINIEKQREEEIGSYLEQDGIVHIEDIIFKTHGIIPTASMIMTVDVLNRVLEFKSTRKYLTVGDIYMQIFGALNTQGALYLKDTMSVYRFLTPTSWSKEWLTSIQKQSEHISAMAKSFKELDELTNFKYSNTFERSTMKRVFYLISLIDKLSQNEELDINLLPAFAKRYMDELSYYLKNNLNENYILYGTGSGAKLILNIIGDKIDFILDSDILKDDTLFMNKRVTHIDNYQDINNKKIIISLFGRYKEIVSSFSEELKQKTISLDDVFAKKCLLKSIGSNSI